MLDIGKMVFDNKSEVVELLTNPGMGVINALRTYAEKNGIVFHDIRLDSWDISSKQLNITDQPTLIVLAFALQHDQIYPFVSLSSPTCKVVKIKYR